MRLSIRLRPWLLSLLPLVVAAAPLVAMANETHSWCIPGDPKDPSSSSVQQVNQVVQYVCSLSNFGYCCDRTSGQGRWDLACIQKGSAYAFNILKQDVCGRYAWTQGPVVDTPSDHDQYYPRDFNVFAVAGTVSNLAHVQGPVAGQGAITASSFNVNSTQQEGLALITQGDLNISNATVYGNAIYGGTYNPQNSGVTYTNGRLYQENPNPLTFPINFGTAQTNLQDMSAALYQYPTTPGSSAKRDSNNNHKVVFKSTDPDLNVFSIVGNLMSGTTTYSFDVPRGSTVIVNVGSDGAVIQDASFTDPTAKLGLRNMLWNFYGTKTLTIQSTGFPASILAPWAATTLKWGSVAGTVVALSANISAELYAYPFRMPGCGGCLCLDQDWSCSNDTTLDDTGSAETLGPEAGFLGSSLSKMDARLVVPLIFRGAKSKFWS